MSLTLEQLDQFGSLDSLPFSLDNNWTDEGVCGPFTLEGLDPFGSIDSLGYSLDDGIWLSTTTCAKIASAEITGTGTLTATADFRLPIFISGSIAGVGTLTSDAFLERLAAGAITGFGSLSASVSRTTDGRRGHLRFWKPLGLCAEGSVRRRVYNGYRKPYGGCV
jgi:hypothetical protein